MRPYDSNDSRRHGAACPVKREGLLNRSDSDAEPSEFPRTSQSQSRSELTEERVSCRGWMRVRDAEHCR